MSARRQVTDIALYRRQKRRAGNFRWILICVFFLACSTAGYFFSISDYFAIQYVNVFGNVTLETDRLRTLAGVEVGQSIFTVDADEVAQYVAIEPYVAVVTVERRMPRTVVITVEEREAVAVLATGQAFVEIDATGLVLKRMRVLDNLDLPLITGVEEFPAGILPGSRIEGDRMTVALAVLQILHESVMEEALANISEIDVSDTQKIRLYTPTSMELRLGDLSELDEKLVLANNIAAYLQRLGVAPNVAYVDVSSTDKPVYMLRQ